MRAWAFVMALGGVAACSVLFPLDGYEGPPVPFDDGGASTATETGATPDAGVGTPAPARLGSKVLVAKDLSEARGVAVDEAFVYWAAAGPSDAGVFRADKASSEVRLIAPDLRGATGISAFVDVQATTAIPEGAVFQMQRNGAGRRAVASGRASPSAVAADDAWIYWAEAGDVFRAARAGGAPELALATGASVSAIAVHEGALFAAGSGGVHRVASRGGVSCRIDPGPATAIAADASGAYWASADGAIRHGGACDAASTTLAQDQGAVSGVGVDEAAVYWITTVPTGVNVARVAKPGGEVQLLSVVQSGSRAQGLAVDPTGVYWAIACCIYKNPRIP